MKKILPKNPLAAAGVGALVGAGIAGYKMWRSYKEGDVSKEDAVAHVVKQSLVFGGVAAVSTVAGGGGGGGASIAAMSLLGIGGRGRSQGDPFAGLLADVLGVSPTGADGGKGQGRSRGQRMSPALAGPPIASEVNPEGEEGAV